MDVRSTNIRMPAAIDPLPSAVFAAKTYDECESAEDWTET